MRVSDLNKIIRSLVQRMMLLGTKALDQGTIPKPPAGFPSTINEFGKTYDLRDRSICHEWLSIKPGDRVLDAGGGHNPLKRADVVVDIDDQPTSHRNGNPLMLYPHQTFVQATLENLPFADGEFDYVFCSQTLEHVEHPDRACKELQRVAKRGLIDTPRSCVDIGFSHVDHRWLIDRIDGTLYFRPKPIRTTGSVLFKNWALLGWQCDKDVCERVDHLYRNVSNNLFEWDGSFKFKVCDEW